MKRFVSLLLACSVGCGAMFGSPTHTVNGPPGTTVDGNPVPVVISSKSSHDVQMPDGRHCTISTHASGAFITLDIVLLAFFIVPGVIALGVDGGTGSWATLDESCPVTIN